MIKKFLNPSGKLTYEEALRQAGERVEKERKDYLTTSNDNTWVERRNGKQKNKHLKKRGIKGAKSHALWKQEHPVLNVAGTVASAAPLAVAAYPFVAGAGEILAGTAAGQAATSGLTWLANAAKATPWVAKSLPWIDAGLTSYFAAHGLDHAINEGIHGPEDAIMTGLEVSPLGRLVKPMWNTGKEVSKAVNTAVENFRYPLGKPQVPEDYITLKPQIRTRVGDVEIDNPGLYYHQSDAGKAKNFVSTGRMRTPLEEYWLAKEEAGEHIPIKLRTGIEPGYPQAPGSAMFSQGNLWYDKLDGIRVNPNKPDLLVTAREMPIANKNASIMSNKASLKALYEQGTRRVTNDNIYTQGPHTPQNTTAYTWEPGYGYRRVSIESPTTIEWADAARTPQITAENVANTTPEISKTAINNSQKIPALSLEEINKAFELARNWHINRISSPSYRSKALRAGFTEEEIPLLRQQLISLIKRLKLLNPKEFLGKNVSARHNFNGKTNAGYWKGLDNKGYLLLGIEFTNPNMSYDDAVSTFVHEFGHGATFGLNGTETSGYMKDLADQFPLINRVVKYNRTLYPEISARRVELAVPGATRTGNVNYYASPTEMLSRGYEFIRDYGINWTKANKAGRLSSTTHKDLVGNRRNSNIFNTIATPKGAINFLKNALGISIPIGIGYDLYNNLSQNEIK